MTEKRSQGRRRGLTALGLIGAAAFITLGALNLGPAPAGPSGKILAGSGSAPANTTFVQPTENAMNMGATATWTTPSSVEPVAKATPPLGAGG
ncbi:hypothetical protein [Mycolicibacterium sp. 050158]|uniref:hypothetical protein n=1 Tax=Mycolicibacterium sp. 050158 TaxID=3090602 RepID=UPI00299E3B82|nr:hypothetical protein [Mycolicibacterium sp. 050158]MDX1892713.1 hypothetical protein [Mycolicibacterium sp. 050158]